MTSQRGHEENSEVLDILFEISELLKTGLDKETLLVLLKLCENDVKPELLAEIILELKKKSALLTNSSEKSTNGITNGSTTFSL